MSLVGGAGGLIVPGGTLDLTLLSPFVGLARETIGTICEVRAPSHGTLVVENLTVFEACCKGEVVEARGRLIVWSGGYPGRGVRRLIELAARAGSTISVWSDLDLDGVRIYRLISDWLSSPAEPFHMSATDVESADRRVLLTTRAEASIRRDLSLHPEAPLSETLRAILRVGAWVEQEALVNPNTTRTLEQSSRDESSQPRRS